MKSVDPYAPEALADKLGFFSCLRDTCPVAKVEDQNFYIVSGYDRVMDVLRDPARFSKHGGSQLAASEHGFAMNQDPPNFAAFRNIYNSYMSPKGARRWAADADRICDALIDTLLPLGSGDLQDLFGKPLPAMITAIVLGMPEGRVDAYRKITDAFLRNMVKDPVEQQLIIDELYALFDEELARRRAALRQAGIAQPKPEHIGSVISDNLISVLMTAQYQGRYLTDEEIRRTIRAFFIGGVDTTGGLIMNVLQRLLEEPSRWQAVVADPALIDAAIQESLRLDSPVVGMFRGTTCPVDVAGETIPEGARVLFSLPSANRDPAKFPDPDTFRLDRKPVNGVQHIAFGSGAHVCAGAWTALTEARIALAHLVRRLPKLRLTAPVTRFDAVNFYVISSFPAAWD